MFDNTSQGVSIKQTRNAFLWNKLSMKRRTSTKQPVYETQFDELIATALAPMTRTVGCGITLGESDDPTSYSTHKQIAGTKIIKIPLTFHCTSTQWYYIDHLSPDVNLRPNQFITMNAVFPYLVFCKHFFFSVIISCTNVIIFLTLSALRLSMRLNLVESCADRM